MMRIFLAKPVVCWFMILLIALGACTPAPVPARSTPGASEQGTPVPVSGGGGSVPATATGIGLTPTAANPVRGASTPEAGSAPVALQAEALDTVVRLTWQPVPQAAGYLVYRDGNETALHAAPVSGTSFEDIGLTNGKSYTYTVAVAGTDGKPGIKSTPVAVTPKLK